MPPTATFALLLALNPSSALVTVRSGDGFGKGVCFFCENGVYIATADHVITDVKDTTVQMQDGRKYRVTVVFRNANDDVAVLTTPDCPVHAVPLAEKPPRPGLSCLIVSSRRKTSFVCSDPTSEQKIYGDLSLDSGESGAALLTPCGLLCGVVSGGWFWTDQKSTWPLRGGVVSRFRLGRLPAHHRVDPATLKTLRSTFLRKCRTELSGVQASNGDLQ